MSGVEGAECEDFYDGEAGVVSLAPPNSRACLKLKTTKDTKEHKGWREYSPSVTS
jgi:hypothetical protein